MSLYDSLIEYTGQSFLPLHMPGHKRNMSFPLPNPIQTDITELPGFESLYEETGLLADLTERIQKLYGSRNSYLLVNGSTGGILTAIRACTIPGDTVLLARNCHTSVYHAIQLLGLHAEYLVPDYDEWGIADGISTACVRAALQLLSPERSPSLVILTSPTYEGRISEISDISTYLHLYGIPLLVDEAHGAHLGFHKAFPGGAVSAGADLVVQSLHKTLPALTQCALLHLNSKIITEDRVYASWCMFQTTSPSFLLLSSVDRCISLLEQHRDSLFEQLSLQLNKFYKDLAELQNLSVQNASADIRDASRIIITTPPGVSGGLIAQLLREHYGIEIEASAPRYLIAITGIADSLDSFSRFSAALSELDRSALWHRETSIDLSPISFPALPEQVCDSSSSLLTTYKSLPYEQCSGYISAEFLYLYPPGIPLLVPGERITDELLSYLSLVHAAGFQLKGPREFNTGILHVVQSLHGFANNPKRRSN